MDDSVFIKVNHCIQYLCGVVFNLLQGKLFDMINKFRKILSCVICDDDDFLFCTEDILKCNDIGMTDFFEKFVFLVKIFQFAVGFGSKFCLKITFFR